MIPKSENRLSDKIMLDQKVRPESDSQLNRTLKRAGVRWMRVISRMNRRGNRPAGQIAASTAARIDASAETLSSTGDAR